MPIRLNYTPSPAAQGQCYQGVDHNQVSINSCSLQTGSQTCPLPPQLPRSMGRWTSYFLIHATSPLDKWVQLRRPVFPHWLQLQFGIPSLLKHLPSSPSLSCSPQWPRAVPTLDFTFVHMISHQWITLLSLHWSLRTWDLHRKSRPRSPRLHFPHCLLSEHTQENFRALFPSLYESFTNSTINRGEENQIRWGCQGAGWTTHVLKESSHLQTRTKFKINKIANYRTSLIFRDALQERQIIRVKYANLLYFFWGSV